MNEDNEPQPSGQELDVDVVSKVLEQVYKQLSSYGESCVPISDVHVLNLRLSIQAPSRFILVNAWDVPLLIAELPDQTNTTWDLVLQQIHPYINGINHVQKIAKLADVDLELIQSTLQPLVAANIAILLDIFHSKAVYASTAAMAWFVKDQDLLQECLHYVVLQDLVEADAQAITTDDLVDLYLSLRPGVTVSDLCLSSKKMSLIDSRRLITFGVIKGFLRRVHKYAQLSEPASVQEDSSRPVTSMRNRQDSIKDVNQAWKLAALSSGWATPPTGTSGSMKARPHKTQDEVKLEQDEKLKNLLDGQHCFDQICVEMSMTEKMILERLDKDRLGKISFFTK